MVRCGGEEEEEREADRPAEVGGGAGEGISQGGRKKAAREIRWVWRLSQTMNPDCGDADDTDRFCLICEVTDWISSLPMCRSQAGPRARKRNERSAQTETLLKKKKKRINSVLQHGRTTLIAVIIILSLSCHHSIKETSGCKLLMQGARR